MSFDQAVEAVLEKEGGFVNDPDDPGGATKYGITKGTLEMWRREPVDIDAVRNLTLDEAKSIYRMRYWLEARCDKMPDALAFVMFDAAVNHGTVRAARLLQQAVGVTDDGIIGRQTLKAVKKADPAAAVDEFMTRRAMLYAKLNPKFHHGWYRRLIDMHRRAVTL